ncbi:MAG TPA: hypothetical protein VFF78_04795 [Anaerolineaceae bacterium]|nr:hypothetical protein [Anaerolineaceae bacterium]
MTPRPSATWTLTPTLVPTSTEVEFDIPEAALTSDRGWAAVVLWSRQSKTYVMVVFDQNWGGARWQVLGWKDPGLSFAPQPLVWSKDGRALFYTHLLKYGDGCMGSWAWNGGDLYRLDLNTGETMQIASPSGYWLALSPDETRLAYLGDKLGIYTLLDGSTREAELKIEEEYFARSIPIYLLDMVWSPDGKSLIIGVVINVCEDDDSMYYSIVRVDADTFEERILLNEHEGWLQPVEWPQAGRFIARDEEGRLWWVDANTGEILGEK